MDVFIKPVKKAVITGRRNIMLKDVAEVYCQGGTNLNLGETPVFTVPEGKGKSSYLISSVSIVRAVGQKLPDASINNLGEMDTLIEYSPKPAKHNRLLDSAKTVFVFVVLFGGAMTAIMSFHSDAQIPAVFQNMYRMFFGIEATKPYIIYVPYSIGLAVGIIVFFNHFAGKYLTQDPTPIEVQMTTYEKETADCVIDNLNRESKNGRS